jgi:hypothetical protein
VDAAARLTAVHEELRGWLERLRRADGGGGADLGTHCLLFCDALTRHHRGEDAELFPALLAADDRLAGVLERLREDHRAVTALLTGLAAASASLPAVPDPAERARFRERLDGVAAILESHFRYEERTLLGALAQPLADPAPAWAVGAGGQDGAHD